MMTSPRLVITMSFSVSGMPRFLSLEIVVVMVHSIIPTLLCCTKVETHKRLAITKVDRKVAFVRSFEFSSILIAHDGARKLDSMLCGPVAGSTACVILSSLLRAGGKLALMKRSEPFLLSN